jgi:hypothetical protein
MESASFSPLYRKVEHTEQWQEQQQGNYSESTLSGLDFAKGIMDCFQERHP